MRQARRPTVGKTASVFDLAVAGKLANKAQIPQLFIDKYEELVSRFQDAGVARDDIAAIAARHRARGRARTPAQFAGLGLPPSPWISRLVIELECLRGLVDSWANNPKRILSRAKAEAGRDSTALATAERTIYNKSMKQRWRELDERPDIAGLPSRAAATEIRVLCGLQERAEASIRAVIAKSRRAPKPLTPG